jgi:hypothetical protein
MNYTLLTETLICPGPGSLTTMAEEKEHNPFFNLRVCVFNWKAGKND